MSRSGRKELKRHGKRWVKIDGLEDGPSRFPVGSSSPSDHLPDGRVNTEGSAEESRKIGEEEEMELQDPFMVFGAAIMVTILSQLDARSLARSCLVSRGWKMIASSDELWGRKGTWLVHVVREMVEVLWQNLSMCEELWLGKAHIPRVSKAAGLSKMASYSLSVMDSRRGRITRNDLCDHTWEFHFSETAPEYWRNIDPYWNGMGSPMRRYFHPDGSITADPGDPVWGGHESCYTTITSLLWDGKIREHYVRINRWPPFHVLRKHDWGWELANHICCYTSVPDAGKEGGTGPLFLVS